MSTATAIREARRARGMSQFELAVAAGVSPATIHRIETDKHRPSDSTAHALARALGLTVNTDIFHTTEAATPQVVCGPTRDTDQPASTAVSPVQPGE